jgi:phosphoglycerol transferase MdoB-like AlkP superfamily enzyme
LLAPVTLYQLLLAKLASGVFYGTLSAAVVALLLWLILGVGPAAPLPALMLVIAGSTLFTLLSLLVLLLPKSPDKGQELFSFLLMPMTFFGCTFYSHAMLESPFSQLALLLPTTYIAEGLRGSYAPALPHLSLEAIGTGLAFVLVLLLPLTVWSFRRRLGDFLWKMAEYSGVALSGGLLCVSVGWQGDLPDGLSDARVCPEGGHPDPDHHRGDRTRTNGRPNFPAALEGVTRHHQRISLVPILPSAAVL